MTRAFLISPSLIPQASADYFIELRRFWHGPCISVLRADKMLTNL